MSESLFMFLSVTAVPLFAGIALLFFASRGRNNLPKAITGISGSISLLVFLFYLFGAGPYFWALHLETKWRPANPKTRSEIESMLSLYTKKEITPEQSGWGRNHKLQSGERMTSYSLLGAPLDVVFTGDDRIVAIYTSYE